MSRITCDIRRRRIGKKRATKLRRVFSVKSIAVLALIASGVCTQSQAETSPYGLSEQIVPYEQFGKGLLDRQRTLTERLDDAFFSQNREREQLIEQRALKDTYTILPDRRSFFGGDRFLSPGPLTPGVKLPTGATWRPSFFVFGTMRTAVQTYHQGPADISEWANRLDIYGNLSLSGTERLLVGFRPFDHNGNYSGYTFEGAAPKKGWNNGLNLDPTTLFFEGDFGEIFPRLDPKDKHNLDYGFSIGRQPLLLQDGIMLDDTVDAIGITRQHLYILGASSARVSALVGLHDVHRGDRIRDNHAHFYALSSAFDYDVNTFEVDAAYVDGTDNSGGDGMYIGLGQTRRYGHWNSTLRANGSWAMQRNTPAVNSGWLFTHELSRTMSYNADIAYLNTYVGVDNYTSVGRDPTTGGPLGRIGLLNRTVGIGTYGTALSNGSGRSGGASLGYQHFFDPLFYHQLLVEVGVRVPYRASAGDTTAALGAQYQWGFGRGFIWALGGFGSVAERGATGFGARTELLRKF